MCSWSESARCPSSPGSDELSGPRPRARVLRLSGPAAVAGVGVVRSAVGPGDAAPASAPNHRNPVRRAHQPRPEPSDRTARKPRLECRSTSDSDETGGELGRLSGGSVSHVLRARHLTLKALGRRPGIRALVMAYSIGYEAKSLPIRGG